MLRRSTMPSLSQCLAVICLWAHLCSVTHILMSFTALVAWLDNQHHVSIQIDGDGSRLVLSHDQSGGPKSVRHSHGLVSRMLVAFSAAPAAEADHLVDFSQASVLVRRSSGQRVESLPVRPSDPGLFQMLRLSEPAPILSASARDCRLAPTGASVTVARTVVILI